MKRKVGGVDAGGHESRARTFRLLFVYVCTRVREHKSISTGWSRVVPRRQQIYPRPTLYGIVWMCGVACCWHICLRRINNYYITYVKYSV